jgi:hypothetical protein
MGFSEAQRREIFDAGYTVLRGQVPEAVVHRAMKAINHSLGEGLDPVRLPTLRAQPYCPEIAGTEVISDLFNRSGMVEMAESVLGQGTFSPPKGGQVALRFPRADDEIPLFRPHLDGFPTATNGVAEGTIGSFTALVGVLLSDLPNANSGNFTVVPGSHRATEAYFQAHGPKAFLEGYPKIEQAAPVQITGRPGDVVFCHYQLGHGIAVNVSPHIRYAAFFRLTHKNHADDKEGRLADIWRDWVGMP